MKTKDVLIGMRETIERGWCTGTAAKNAHGFGVAPTDEEAASWCLAGAAMKTASSVMDRHRAYEAIRSVLCSNRTLSEINDAPGESKESIISYIDRAIGAP